MATKRKKKCHHCGRIVALRNINSNKAFYPHKCNHDKPCSAGSALNINNQARCTKCFQLTITKSLEQVGKQLREDALQEE